jgi:hypothetical protein
LKPHRALYAAVVAIGDDPKADDLKPVSGLPRRGWTCPVEEVNNVLNGSNRDDFAGRDAEPRPIATREEKRPRRK